MSPDLRLHIASKKRASIRAQIVIGLLGGALLVITGVWVMIETGAL
jgi:hypothetical protein